ncbi:MAG: methyl-accepting chemotaxis protein [Nitrospinae bacterium]|nr:methyl-accepting chemotaxis protein [Nitrospinota bacterium]
MKKHRSSKINYSIKTHFQIMLFLKVTVIVLVSIIVTTSVFYFYANREIGDSFKHFHVTARNFLDYLLPAVMVSGGLGIVVALGITLFFPHSFAGPLYRIERDMKEKIGEGDLTIRFKLRNGDQVKELAESLNIMLEKLNLKIRDIKTISNDLSLLSSAKENLPIEELKVIQEKLAEAVQKFKTQ